MTSDLEEQHKSKSTIIFRDNDINILTCGQKSSLRHNACSNLGGAAMTSDLEEHKSSTIILFRRDNDISADKRVLCVIMPAAIWVVLR